MQTVDVQPIRKINDELAIAGQIRLEDVPQIAAAGYRSILNLRSPSETGFLIYEDSIAAQWQLRYANCPFESEMVSDEAATHVLRVLTQLPKPALIHCDNAVRAAAIVLMYLATRQGATLDQAFTQATRLGLFSVLTQG